MFHILSFGLFLAVTTWWFHQPVTSWFTLSATSTRFEGLLPVAYQTDMMLSTKNIQQFVPAAVSKNLALHGKRIRPKELSKQIYQVRADELLTKFTNVLGSSPGHIISKQEIVMRNVWKWVQAGFPNISSCNIRVCKHLYVIVFAWLMPDCMELGNNQKTRGVCVLSWTPECHMLTFHLWFPKACV